MASQCIHTTPCRCNVWCTLQSYHLASHVAQRWLSPIFYQVYATNGRGMCAQRATFILHMMVECLEFCIACNALCFSHTFSTLRSLHTMQGKNPSFTLHEPKEWVQAKELLLTQDAYIKNHKTWVRWVRFSSKVLPIEVENILDKSFGALKPKEVL